MSEAARDSCGSERGVTSELSSVSGAESSAARRETNDRTKNGF